MTDNHDINHAPDQGGASIVLSGARPSLVARGRKDAASLVKPMQGVLLARVSRDGVNGKWGLIDNEGKFVTDHLYDVLEPFCEARAAFSDTPVDVVNALDRYISRGDGYRIPDDLEKKNPSSWACRRFGNWRYGSWGYIDHNGRSITTMRFEAARKFSEGLAGVLVNGKWGFINKDGEVVVEPRFDGVREFHGGLCLAKLDGKYGFVNSNGEFTVDPRFDFLGEYSDGLACAAIVRGSYGYIDSGGEYIISPQFSAAHSFRSGFARVEAGSSRGYINKNGSYIYRAAGANGTFGDFTDGIALFSLSWVRRIIRVDDSLGRLSGAGLDLGDQIFLDMNGQSILRSQGQLTAAADFSEGLGLVRLKIYGKEERDSKYLFGFVDANGQIRIRPQFLNAMPFKNGRARVSTEHCGCRLIDRSGAIVSDVSYGHLADLPEEFSEGYALLRVGPYFQASYGFINTAGEISIEPQFTWAYSFCNGLARVHGKRVINAGDQRIGYIDTTGKLVIPYQFPGANDFQRIEP